MKTLVGTPATAMMIVCPVCNCESFRLLAPAPVVGMEPAKPVAPS